MSKSLNARCIRRWEVKFKSVCDSKHNPYWRKSDLRGYIREAALTTAYSMSRAWLNVTPRLTMTVSRTDGRQNFRHGIGSAMSST